MLVCSRYVYLQRYDIAFRAACTILADHMTDDTKYYVGFSHFLGIGPVTFQKLMKHFGDVRSAYCAQISDLHVVIPPKLAREFDQFRRSFRLKDEVAIIRDQGIHIVTYDDERYPDQFRHLHAPPVCLYVKGDIANHQLSDWRHIAIVGSRRSTSYGRKVSRMLATELAGGGWTVVSGMALGIDAQAHWGAVEAGGRTIAVLGCGVNIIYPWDNRLLYQEILSHSGIILSEFPPDMNVRKGYFVTRNRLISALSVGTVVVEGKETSGALITARHALEQGKDVFACPGPITSELSDGPHVLLQNGAKLIRGVSDICEEYEQRVTTDKQHGINMLLEEDEKRVYEQLLNESMTMDMLSESLQIRITHILPTVSSLEMKGVIKQGDDGRYECCV